MADSWDSYWKTEANRDYWEQPDDFVVRIVQGLDRSRVKDVLDLGCGIGRHTVLLARCGFNVTALDSSEEALAILSDRLSGGGLHATAVRTDCATADFAPESFDFVLAYNVIYHGQRRDVEDAVQNVRRWLRPGGVFFFTCPSRRDGKFGSGERVAPNTFKPLNSVHPGDVHYFADETDIDGWLHGFKLVAKDLQEHYWENTGIRQFSSYWHVLAQISRACAASKMTS